MKNTLCILAVLLVLLWAVPVWAAQPTGEFYSSFGVEWDGDVKSAEFTTARTGFRAAVEESMESGRLHFSLKGWIDWKRMDVSAAVDQFWLKGYFRDLDWQVGKQLISWGTADGFNPTNYFSRIGSDALFSGDLRGDAVWAGRLEYYAPDWSASGVVIPVFTPQKIDTFMREMILEADPQGTQLIKAVEGTKKPGWGNPEVALRVETQLEGFDLQVSYFRGYEPLPGLEIVLGPGFPSLEGTYRQQQFIGMAVAGTLGPAGVWAEMAYGGPEKFAKSENPFEMRIPLSINKKYFQAVVGGDYTLDIGDGLLVQAQYIYRGQGSFLEPYVMPKETREPGEIKPAHYLYGRLSYSFGIDTTADLLVLYGTVEEGGVIRPSLTHRLGDGVQLELSLLQPFGEKSKFDSIPRQAALTVKYLF
ncbi:MAG: hypothetical protein WAP20_10810 [Limnochordia bacterium]